MTQNERSENFQNLHDPDFDEPEEEVTALPSPRRSGVASQHFKETAVFSWEDIINHIPPRIAFVIGLILSLLIIATVGFLWALPLIWKQITSGA